MLFLKILKVEGDSMYPTIKNGNKTVVSFIPYLFINPKIGDIVIAKHPHKNIKIIKRITKIQNMKYFIEGDNNESSDSKEFNAIPKNLILAKLILKF